MGGATAASCHPDGVKSGCQQGCSRHCLKDDTREIRDLREIKTMPALQRLIMGIPVQFGDGEEANIAITPEITALELQVFDPAGDTLTHRIPLAQVVNTSSANRCLFLHFSEAMAKDPWKITFANETETLSLAFTLRVLCARHS